MNIFKINQAKHKAVMSDKKEKFDWKKYVQI